MIRGNDKVWRYQTARGWIHQSPLAFVATLVLTSYGSDGVDDDVDDEDRRKFTELTNLSWRPAGLQTKLYITRVSVHWDRMDLKYTLKKKQNGQKHKENNSLTLAKNTNKFSGKKRR